MHLTLYSKLLIIMDYLGYQIDVVKIVGNINYARPWTTNQLIQPLVN